MGERIGVITGCGPSRRFGTGTVKSLALVEQKIDAGNSQPGHRRLGFAFAFILGRDLVRFLVHG